MQSRARLADDDCGLAEFEPCGKEAVPRHMYRPDFGGWVIDVDSLVVETDHDYNMRSLNLSIIEHRGPETGDDGSSLQ